MSAQDLGQIARREYYRGINTQTPSGLYISDGITIPDGPSQGISRRNFLKRSASVGGLVTLAGGLEACTAALIRDTRERMQQLGINVFVVKDEEGKTSYVALTPDDDQDNLTAREGKGMLTTEYYRLSSNSQREKIYEVSLSEDLKKENFRLKVSINGLPIEDFFGKVFGVKGDEQGIYSNLTDKNAPYHYFWNPGGGLFRGNLPSSYTIKFEATDGNRVSTIETGTPIIDDFIKYVHEINVRNAISRNTDDLLQNVKLGYVHAKDDLADFLKSLTVGYKVRDVHTGKEIEKDGTLESLFYELPKNLVTGEFKKAYNSFLRIPGGIIDAWGFLLSAISNSIINSITHLSIGLASPMAASYTTDLVGTTLQMHAKNLPFGERFNTVVDPRTYLNWDCAHCGRTYTRTGAQMLTDFAVSGIQSYGIYKLVFEKGSKRRQGPDQQQQQQGGNGGNGGGDGGGAPPPPAPPPPVVPPPPPPVE